MHNIHPTHVDELIRTIVRLDQIEEAQAFFRDLLTEHELAEFARRWHAAQLLDTHHSYTEIIKQTGLSSTTVARIAKWLHHGKGGYRAAIAKVEAP